jgi:hypothetical protein
MSEFAKILLLVFGPIAVVFTIIALIGGGAGDGNGPSDNTIEVPDPYEEKENENQ